MITNLLPPADIKAARAKRHISQKDLATILDVSVTTIQSWERGTRNPRGIYRRQIQMMLADDPSWEFPG